MIAASGVQDLLRLAGRAREEGLGFRLASILDGFDATADGPFDRRYMGALYAYGEAAGRLGRWMPLPAGVLG
jgi:hypothetical protein